MNQSEIAEQAARRIWCIQSGCENIEVCNHTLDTVELAEMRIFQGEVERAIAESQAPQPKCPRCDGVRRVKKPDGLGSMTCPECRLGDGEPSPPLKCQKCGEGVTFEVAIHLGLEPPSLPLFVACGICNHYIGNFAQLPLRSGAAQEVSLSASEIRSDDPSPSCHVCGEIMVNGKCLKCGATTGCSDEEVSPPSQEFGRIEIRKRGNTSYAYLPDREREADGSDFLALLGDKGELKAALQRLADQAHRFVQFPSAGEARITQSEISKAVELLTKLGLGSLKE